MKYENCNALSTLAPWSLLILHLKPCVLFIPHPTNLAWLIIILLFGSKCLTILDSTYK